MLFSTERIILVVCVVLRAFSICFRESWIEGRFCPWLQTDSIVTPLENYIHVSRNWLPYFMLRMNIRTIFTISSSEAVFYFITFSMFKWKHLHNSNNWGRYSHLKKSQSGADTIQIPVTRLPLDFWLIKISRVTTFDRLATRLNPVSASPLGVIRVEQKKLGRRYLKSNESASPWCSGYTHKLLYGCLAQPHVPIRIVFFLFHWIRIWCSHHRIWKTGMLLLCVV